MFVFDIIKKVRNLFSKKVSKDLSNCFAPMTVVYHCGEDAYQNEWGKR